MRIKTYALTDVGMVREKNEDSCWVGTFSRQTVLLVADGMGGHGHGDVASATAVAAARERLERFNNDQRSSGRKQPGPAATLDDAIFEAMETAHKNIRAKGAAIGGPLSMGTTFTLAVITEDLNSAAGEERKKNGTLKVAFGHIGDSKLYHIRGEMVVQKSTDHTMLQRMLDAGALKPEEIENFGHKNIIYKSLGGSDKLELDPPQQFTLDHGDALLLCSDGLSNYIQREEMAIILAETPTLKAAARYLVNLAKYRGGDDNITVILAEYGEFTRDHTRKLERIAKTKRASRSGSGGRRFVVFSLLAALLALFVMLLVVLRPGFLSGKGAAKSAHVARSGEGSAATKQEKTPAQKEQQFRKDNPQANSDESRDEKKDPAPIPYESQKE